MSQVKGPLKRGRAHFSFLLAPKHLFLLSISSASALLLNPFFKNNNSANVFRIRDFIVTLRVSHMSLHIPVIRDYALMCQQPVQRWVISQSLLWQVHQHVVAFVGAVLSFSSAWLEAIHQTS